MKISVIIPNYNDLRVQRAVASVRAQTYADYELIVMDGGSSNEELLSYYRTQSFDHLVIERDKGIFDAINKGIARARGDLIFLMGADDELSDGGVFETVVSVMRARGELDGACIGCEFVNAADRVVRSWYPSSISARKMKLGVLPPHFSLFLKRELYQSLGVFRADEFPGLAGDTVWLMDLAMAKPDLRIEVVPRHHLRMQVGGTSTGSLSAIRRQFWLTHAYARANASRLPMWFAYAPVKVLSKVFQLRYGRRVQRAAAAGAALDR